MKIKPGINSDRYSREGEKMGVMLDFMNPPEPPDGFGYTERDSRSKRLWMHCCYCGKKAFPLDGEMNIDGVEWVCKGCGKTFKMRGE